jgi:hypothetical protein
MNAEDPRGQDDTETAAFYAAGFDADGEMSDTKPVLQDHATH